jgi:DNA-binding MarR family transcriptional regulator
VKIHLPARWILMEALADSGAPVWRRDLAERTGVPYTTVADALRSPVRCGWVALTKEPHPSGVRGRRRLMYSITEAGRAQLRMLAQDGTDTPNKEN